MLPAHLLERRHRMIVAVLAAHIPGLLLFGLARGYGLGHVLFDIGPVIALTVIAMLPRVPLRWRMIAACTGLITCSALLVHLWGGVIEAHFHFFVMIGLLTLYQDWVPFLLAIGYVVLHHGVMGVLQPDGSPSPVQRVLIKPPSTRVGPLTPEERNIIVTTDTIGTKYDTVLDRESAEEILKAKGDEAAAAAAASKAQNDAEKAAAEKARQDAIVAKETARAEAAGYNNLSVPCARYLVRARPTPRA